MSYSLDVVEDSVLPDGRAVSDGWCVIGAAFGQAAWLSSGGRSEANGETTGKPVQKTNEGDVRRNRIWETGRKFLDKKKRNCAANLQLAGRHFRNKWKTITPRSCLQD